MAEWSLALLCSNKTPTVSRPCRLFFIACLSLVTVAHSAAAFIVVRCCINSTNMTPCLSQNTVSINLCIEIVCLALTLTSDVVWYHFFDCRLDSGVMWETRISYPVTIFSKNWSPSLWYQSKKPRTQAFFFQFLILSSETWNPTCAQFAKFQLFGNDFIQSCSTTFGNSNAKVEIVNCRSSRIFSSTALTKFNCDHWWWAWTLFVMNIFPSILEKLSPTNAIWCHSSRLSHTRRLFVHEFLAAETFFAVKNRIFDRISHTGDWSIVLNILK